MDTYIPKQEKIARERIEAKLDVEVIRTLERYCEYLDSDRDYVVGQALVIAFKKDKGFAEWLSAQPVVEERGEASPQGRKGRKTNAKPAAASYGQSAGAGAL